MRSQIPFDIVPGFTRDMGKGQPEYATLPIRDEISTFKGTDDKTYQAQVMTCCFRPTQEQIAMIARGEMIYLTVMGSSWPPVSLVVGDPKLQPGEYYEQA